jgi:hypothetical protein
MFFPMIMSMMSVLVMMFRNLLFYDRNFLLESYYL